MRVYYILMNLISTKEAADRKSTSQQVIIGAINREVIDAVRIGGVHLVKANRKFERWELSERHIEAARTRWKKKTSKSRKRKG